MIMPKKCNKKINDRSFRKKGGHYKNNKVKKLYKMSPTTKKHSKQLKDQMRNNQLFYIDNQPSTSAQGREHQNPISKCENQSRSTSKHNHKTYYRKMLKSSMRTPKKNGISRRPLTTQEKLKLLLCPKNKQSNYLSNELQMNNQISNYKSDTLKENEVVEIHSNDIINDQTNDDDCICIESNIESIVIEDDTPDETMILLDSFSKRSSSTPLHKRRASVTLSDGSLLYFKDVEGRPFMHTTNKVQYNKNLSVLGTKLKQPLDKKVINDANENSIIVLDETESFNTIKTAKNIDDSVVFVSESKDLEFIPLTTDKVPNTSKKSTEKCSTPKHSNKIHKNAVSLFTASEKKRLNEYNSNAYNPDAEIKQNTSLKRMVIVDGSNVAFSHSLNKCFSVRGIQIVIKYFEKIGHEIKVVVPQFRLGRCKSTEPEELERLHRQGKVVFTPCKKLPGISTTSYDDRFILQLAFELDAVIVSNDNYRDLIHENIAFKKIIENRVVGYSWCNDIFILPKDPYGKWGPPLSSILNRI